MASRSAAKTASKDKNKDRELTMEQLRFEDESSRRDVAFQAALGDYYGRQARATTAKGWDNFYTGDKPALNTPAMPNIQQYLVGAVDPQAVDPANPFATPGGGATVRTSSGVAPYNQFAGGRGAGGRIGYPTGGGG